MALTGSIQILIKKFHADPHSGEILGALAGALLIAGVIELSIEAVTTIHWSLAMLLTVASGLLVAWFSKQTTRFGREDSISIFLLFFLFAVLLGAVACAGCAYVLHTEGWAQYQAPPKATMEMFRNYFLWTFVDMVPTINFWKMFPVRPQVAPADLVAGLPILVFRLFVLGYLFASLARWWKSLQINAA